MASTCAAFLAASAITSAFIVADAKPHTIQLEHRPHSPEKRSRLYLWRENLSVQADSEALPNATPTISVKVSARGMNKGVGVCYRNRCFAPVLPCSIFFAPFIP